MVDGEVYKRIRILAIERNMEVSALIEEAMREKLEREYPQYHQQSQPPQPTGVDADNKEKDRISKTIHQFGEEPPNRLTGVDAEDKDKDRMYKPKIVAREVEEQPQEQQPQQEPQQSQSKQQTPLLKSLGKGIVPALGEDEKESRLWMPGLKFPMTKEKLIQFAKKQDQNLAYKDVPEILPIMEELPNEKKIYKDISQLEEDVKKIYNANRWKIIEGYGNVIGTYDSTKVVECEIVIDKDKNKFLNSKMITHN